MHTAASSPHALRLALYWWPLGIARAAVYFTLAYRRFHLRQSPGRQPGTPAVDERAGPHRATPARGAIGAGQSLLYVVVAALLLVAAAVIVVVPDITGGPASRSGGRGGSTA